MLTNCPAAGTRKPTIDPTNVIEQLAKTKALLYRKTSDVTCRQYTALEFRCIYALTHPATRHSLEPTTARGMLTSSTLVPDPHETCAIFPCLIRHNLSSPANLKVPSLVSTMSAQTLEAFWAGRPIWTAWSLRKILVPDVQPSMYEDPPDTRLSTLSGLFDELIQHSHVHPNDTSIKSNMTEATGTDVLVGPGKYNFYLHHPPPHSSPRNHAKS